MKRFAMGILLMAATSLALGQSGTLKNSSGKATAKDSIAESIIDKERALLDAVMKKDIKAYQKLVASHAIMNTLRGRVSVKDFTDFAFSPDYNVSNATIEDPQVMMIDKTAAILTYKLTATDSVKGTSSTGTAYAATVWVKRGGEWKAVFFQSSIVSRAPVTTNSSQKDN